MSRKRAWPRDIRKLVESFPNLTPEDLPPSPFELQPRVTIRDGAVWLASMKHDVAAGVDGPRFGLGAIQEDLRFLKARVKQHRAALRGKVMEIDCDKLRKKR